MSEKFVIGLDYGTDSVRAIIVDAVTGSEMASAESKFVRWSKGLYCDASQNQYRQHPLDYMDGLESAVQKCLAMAGTKVQRNVCGIAVATTGSTPVAADKSGVPLSLLDSFSDDPDAMFLLWKDHTAIREADEINIVSKNYEKQYLQYVGGTYSSEWFWAKLLHVLRLNKKVRAACRAWIEHSDWIPFLLTGGQNAIKIKRNVCAAGHKALWSEKFEGLPPVEFFLQIDPMLVPFAKNFGSTVYAAGQFAGNLCEEWAGRLGLHTNVAVGVGAIDAHAGAVGGGIRPYEMCKVIGTSTCDMLVVPEKEMQDVVVEGICGQVTDSIVPGMVGLEAGQSAFGDIYSWFRDLLLWPLKISSNDLEIEEASKKLFLKLESFILMELDKSASQLPLDENAEFAIDWFNGRRTPHANPDLKGIIGGLTLGSDPVRIYRALVESTCFGSRAILESIEEQGIRIEKVNAMGGISSKSPFVVQMLADVLNRPVQVSSVQQTVATGAAIFASVAAGIHSNIETAGEKMISKEMTIVLSRKEYVKYYNRRYEQYKKYGKLQESAVRCSVSNY